MRNSIMNVQQIQFFILDDIDQFTCQGCIIRGIIKERIFFGIDFVEKNIFLEMGQADRSLIGDKVNLMSFCRQRKAKFCGHNTRTTVGRITNYSNTHIKLKIRPKYRLAPDFR